MGATVDQKESISKADHSTYAFWAIDLRNLSNQLTQSMDYCKNAFDLCILGIFWIIRHKQVNRNEAYPPIFKGDRDQLWRIYCYRDHFPRLLLCFELRTEDSQSTLYPLGSQLSEDFKLKSWQDPNSNLSRTVSQKLCSGKVSDWTRHRTLLCWPWHTLARSKSAIVYQVLGHLGHSFQ